MRDTADTRNDKLMSNYTNPSSSQKILKPSSPHEVFAMTFYPRRMAPLIEEWWFRPVSELLDEKSSIGVNAAKQSGSARCHALSFGSDFASLQYATRPVE